MGGISSSSISDATGIAQSENRYLDCIVNEHKLMEGTGALSSQIQHGRKGGNNKKFTRER